MRIIPSLFFVPLFGACVPVSKVEPPQTAAIIEEAPIRLKPIPTTAPDSVATAPARSPRFLKSEISRVSFEGVGFDSRTHRLVVVDQAGGPASRFADAGEAARSLGGVAAVNAGFFTPEGAPLGLVISEGNSAGAWNTASSLGSGAWHENPVGDSAISRREALGRGGAGGMRHLIQAGPLLVENGRPVSGLETTKSSVRMVVLWDGGTKWWIGRGSPCTLSALGRALAAGQPAGWKTSHALNLDGGRSADLWVSSAIAGGPWSKRPAWNRPVRNFLVLVRR